LATNQEHKAGQKKTLNILFSKNFQCFLWNAKKKRICKAAPALMNRAAERVFAASALNTTGKTANCLPAYSARKQRKAMIEALRNLLQTGKAESNKKIKRVIKRAAPIFCESNPQSRTCAFFLPPAFQAPTCLALLQQQALRQLLRHPR